MNKSSENPEKQFFLQFTDLYDLYIVVKEAIIIAENYAKEHKIYIAPLNQLRSALDHVFKASKGNAETIKYELKEAREHIVRAGYDAYEVIASKLGLDIQKRLEPYSTETLTNVFPEYFQDIKPKLVEIKKVLGEIRTAKNETNGKDIPDAFEKYFDELKILIEIEKETTKKVPALEDYQNRRRSENRRGKIFQIGLTIFGVIAAFILGVIFKSNNLDNKSTDNKLIEMLPPNDSTVNPNELESN